MARVKEMYQSVKQRVKKSSPQSSIVATPATPQVTDTVNQLAGPCYSEHTPGDAPTSLSSPVSARASAPAKTPAPSNVPALADGSEATKERRLSGSKEDFPQYDELLSRGPEQNVHPAPAGNASSDLPPYTSSPPAALTKDAFQPVEQSGLDITSPLDLQLMAETYLDSEGQELVDHESTSNHSDMIQASRFTGRSSMSAPKLSLPLRSNEADSGFFGSPEPSAALDGTFDVASATQSQISSKSASPTTKSDVAAESKPRIPPRSPDRPNCKAPEVLPNVRSTRRSSWGISQSLNMFKEACTTWKGHPSRVIPSDHTTFHAPLEHQKARAPSPFGSSIETSGIAKRKREEDDDVSPITPLDGKTDLATPNPSQSEGAGNIVKSLYGTHYRTSSFVPKLENMDLIVPMNPEDIPLPSTQDHANQRNPSHSSSMYSDRDAEYTGKLNDHLPGLLVATGAENEVNTQHAAMSDLPAESEQPNESSRGCLEEKLPAVMESNDKSQPNRLSDVSAEDDEGASEVERLFNAVFVGWRADDSQQDTFTATQSAVVDGPANDDGLATGHKPQQPSTPCKEAISSTTASLQDENSSPNIGTPDSWTSKARKLANRKSKLWSTWKKVSPGKFVKVSPQPAPASSTGENEVETEYDAGDCEGSDE